jgi:hypothetical protein
MQDGSEPQIDRQLDLGQIGQKGRKDGLLPVDVVAGALSAVWIVAIIAYFWSSSIPEAAGQGVRFGLVLTLLIVFLPLVLIWTAAITLRSVRALRHEAQRLQTAVEAMRQAFVANQQGAGALKPAMERKLDEIAQSTRQAESTIASFASRRDSGLTQASADRKAALMSPPEDPAAEQTALALGTPSDALRRPVSAADFIRALQFPESPDDKEGFRALRLALDDRDIAKLIRAAQDVLTLLSQEGIYMDDLKPDRAHPDVWRRFAAGERGRAIAGLGGIRDRSSLALTAARMREDTIFRDAAHHFLRSFDRSVASFEQIATDAELAALAETRTARAFMILGRVAGIFD